MTPFLVRVRFQPGMRVRGGKLADAGAEVHAATFLRERLVILDAALLREPEELKRIWVHEVFHFVWWRLGNARRAAWEQLLRGEQTPGELGWSAEWRKRKLTARDWSARTRRWREYCCESFCDSAAWLLSGIGRHGEFTLPRACRTSRRRWLEKFLGYNGS